MVEEAVCVDGSGASGVAGADGAVVIDGVGSAEGDVTGAVDFDGDGSGALDDAEACGDGDTDTATGAGDTVVTEADELGMLVAEWVGRAGLLAACAAATGEGFPLWGGVARTVIVAPG